MPTVPESDLQHVLNRLIDVTTRNASARKTAVRWFNRLYYDVRRWNESFITFLRTYPGLANSTSPAEYKQFIERLREYRDSLQDRDGINDYRARLMIVGGQMDDPEFIRCIESTGALVVADRMCTGSLIGSDIIHTDNEPLYDIAAHYLRKTSCPRMMEDFRHRVATIVETAREYNVDGVIIHHIKFCDIWGIEGRVLSSRLRKFNIPVLCLDREYVMAGEGQMRTRVQAFLESMGK